MRFPGLNCRVRIAIAIRRPGRPRQLNAAQLADIAGNLLSNQAIPHVPEHEAAIAGLGRSHVQAGTPALNVGMMGKAATKPAFGLSTNIGVKYLRIFEITHLCVYAQLSCTIAGRAAVTSTVMRSFESTLSAIRSITVGWRFPPMTGCA